MAARLNPKHTEQVLERIKLRQLVNRLQQNALGELKVTNGVRKGEKYSMGDGEIRSAIFLLERRLARAEAPKDINLGGNINLVIKQYGSGPRTT